MKNQKKEDVSLKGQNVPKGTVPNGTKERKKKWNLKTME